MSLALLMDIDGTLTPPRRTLLPEMAEALKKLIVPFHVAAGSDLVLVEPQFLRPLWDFGFRKDFEAFVSNGAAHFRCSFSRAYAVEKIGEFDFGRSLGPENYALLIQVLEDILSAEEFKLPDSVWVMGERIMDRGSMLNFSTIGRAKGNLTDEARENRDRFARFDKATNYRRKILAHLNDKLAKLVREKKLRIMLGGETSFDLVIEGKDKTNAVRGLLDHGYKRVVFLGDALFPGGNDSVITDFINNWNAPDPCPLTAIPVEGWLDTIRVFHDQGWIEH
jgi:hydroxymethylpyrimidine pyrophosphatase-like HAD family hydrolase